MNPDTQLLVIYSLYLKCFPHHKGNTVEKFRLYRKIETVHLYS